MFQISRLKTPFIPLLMILTVISYGQEQCPFHKATTPLPWGRQMYGAVVVGEYLYIIGGNTEQDEYVRSVQKAFIKPDGSLGSWEETTPLPAPRCYISNTTLRLGNRIYVVHGLHGEIEKSQRTILWTGTMENGHLGLWRESMPCPGDAVSCSVAVAAPGYIHLIGGTIGSQTPTSRVWSASVAPDGKITGWEIGPSLPVPLWFHSGGVANGKVWIWGGLTTSDKKSVNQTIYAAPVSPDGKLGPWERTDHTLPRGFYSGSCSVYSDYLMTICPRYEDGSFSGDVWTCTVNPKGLDSWEKINCNLPPKLYLGVATDYRHGYVYIPGGRLSKTSYELDPNVYYLSLTTKHENFDSNEAGDVERALPPGELRSPPRVSMPETTPKITAERSLPGFVSYEEGQQISMMKSMPIVLYFHFAKDGMSSRQNDILRDFQPHTFNGKLLFVETDAGLEPDVARRFNITTTPSWLFYDEDGNLEFTLNRVISLSELNDYAARISK